MIAIRFLCLAVLLAPVLVTAPAEAKTKAGITPLSVCSTKDAWEKLNQTLMSRAHAYNMEFLARVAPANPKHQDKKAAARDARASTGKGQPVDLDCRPLPGGTVHVDDKGGFSGYMCVRAPKWKSCGWIGKRYFTGYFGATSDPAVWRRSPEPELLFMFR